MKPEYIYIDGVLAQVTYSQQQQGGGKGSSPPPPDYTPMAQASKEASEIGAALGREQLAESTRQYDLNKVTADRVVDKQLGLMDQTKAQGDDYYKYMQDTYRPLERGMVDTANREGSDARLEEQAGLAAADVRRGQAQQANMMMRQGLRYGYSPAKLAAGAAQLAGANSSAIAGATTSARNTQRNLGWARQMDAAGLGRNLTGASQGAYGLTISSGNAAMGNQMQPGNALLGGMAQGAGMQQTGQGQRIQGLGSILSSQTSMYNAGQNQGDGGLGDVIGTGIAAYGAF